MNGIRRWLRIPLVQVLIFIAVFTLFAIWYLPIVELQTEFWVATLLTYGIGDSVTTGLLGNYGREEQDRGYTRRICGAEPTLPCSFATRFVALVALFGVYSVVIVYGVGVDVAPIALGALSIPVVFSSGGLGATVVNTYAIVTSPEF